MACPIEHPDSFGKLETKLIDRRGQSLRVSNQPATRFPLRICDVRKCAAHRAYGAFSPKPPVSFVHLIFENRLHQPVKTQGTGFRIAPEKGKAAGFFDGVAQAERSSGGSA